MPRPAKFTLDAAALERVFALWNIPLPLQGSRAGKASNLVLFALRGASPDLDAKASKTAAADARGWVSSAELTITPPDYRRMRCTLGLWNRATGKLFVAPGSTVPHLDNVAKAAARKGAMAGRGTNQLEPGYYLDLTKGEHLQGKPQGHAALRQTGPRFYRRAREIAREVTREIKKGVPPYTLASPLFFGNPYDNLHCAWNPDVGAEGYRSAGCLVVAGWPHSPRLTAARPSDNRNKGPWKTFHDLLYAAPQKTFPLLLLPAIEVAGALKEQARRSPRKAAPSAPEIPATWLVYGSEGPEVERLQRRLAARGFYKGSVTGKLGVSTYRAWNASGFV